MPPSNCSAEHLFGPADSRSSSRSPTQTIGVSPYSSAAFVFAHHVGFGLAEILAAFAVGDDHVLAPTACSMWPETSPVTAPSLPQ